MPLRSIMVWTSAICKGSCMVKAGSRRVMMARDRGSEPISRIWEMSGNVIMDDGSRMVR